jgi:hypothetical protein
MLRRFVLAAIVTLALAPPATSNTISNVDFDPDSPATLPFGEFVDFTFDFDVSEDARIFGRPLFEGVLRPDYLAHPSPLYSGMGSGSGFFTIGDTGLPVAYVDEIRFQIFNADQSMLLHEIFVPVDFTFGAVPEPASVSLLATGLLAAAGVRRLRRRGGR